MESYSLCPFVTGSWRSFFVQFFSVFLPPLFNIFCFCQVHTISVLYWAHCCMKCSLGIFNFLEEISSHSHSVVFLHFFALITKKGFLISPCYSLQLCIWMGISFLLSKRKKKDLRDQVNHSGVITHLEPDILEYGVKWALGSITTSKASGGDGIPLSYFKSSKTMLWKCCTRYASTFGKLSNGHRTGKGQFSFQSQRKAMPKNAQTIAQIHTPS